MKSNCISFQIEIENKIADTTKTATTEKKKTKTNSQQIIKIEANQIIKMYRRNRRVRNIMHGMRATTTERLISLFLFIWLSFMHCSRFFSLFINSSAAPILSSRAQHHRQIDTAASAETCEELLIYAAMRYQLILGGNVRSMPRDATTQHRQNKPF